ncbi:MAG: class II aldolase/adducin family protein [Candidatus Riflebacteria bacterium]|nr:class II aldolase/adducin family protein [Candidatus Riflebacteria bacterium]
MAAEGVVKFHEERIPGPPPDVEAIRELCVWRTILYDLGMIGGGGVRYGGLGYGNASARVRPYDLSKGKRAFLITGTQTGHHHELGPEHFALVQAYDMASNSVRSAGPSGASSESLTHGAVYDQSPLIRWVFHVHAPAIWTHRHALGIPSTRPDAEYGSSAMARDLWRLFGETELRTLRIFAMSGHQDGIVCFGGSAGEVGGRLVEYLAMAMLRR